MTPNQNNRNYSKTVAILSISALVLLVFLTFKHSLNNGFVDWDDPIYLTNNHLILDISTKNLIRIFTTFISGNYHPLTITTYAIEHYFFGLNPFYYKLDNLILHILCVVILYIMILRASNAPLISLILASFFALHPMRVETVAWISDRKDLLCTFFSLLTLHFEVKFLQDNRKRDYFATIATTLLALLAKGTAIVLLPCQLLVGLLYGQRLNRLALFRKLPHLLIALGFTGMAFWARESYNSVLHEHSLAFVEILLTSCYRFIAYYLARTIIPAPHLFPAMLPSAGIGDIRVLLSVVTIFVLFLAWLITRRKTPLPLWIALTFFAVALAPALPLPNVGYSADRFSYFPTAGLLFSLAHSPFVRWRGHWVPRCLLPALLLTLITVSAVVTSQRCTIWANSPALWSDAIEIYRQEQGMETQLACYLVYRARAWVDLHREDRALPDFEHAHAISPNVPEPYISLGNTLLETNRPAEAITSFSKQLSRRPGDVTAHIGRAQGYYRTGQTNSALTDLDDAMHLAPQRPDIYIALAQINADLGHLQMSADYLSKLIELNPDDDLAFYRRALIYAALGKSSLELKDLEEAVRLNPENRAAQLRLANRLGAR